MAVDGNHALVICLSSISDHCIVCTDPYDCTTEAIYLPLPIQSSSIYPLSVAARGTDVLIARSAANMCYSSNRGNATYMAGQAQASTIAYDPVQDKFIAVNNGSFVIMSYVNNLVATVTGTNTAPTGNTRSIAAYSLDNATTYLWAATQSVYTPWSFTLGLYIIKWSSATNMSVTRGPSFNQVSFNGNVTLAAIPKNLGIIMVPSATPSPSASASRSVSCSASASPSSSPMPLVNITVTMPTSQPNFAIVTATLSSNNNNNNNNSNNDTANLSYTTPPFPVLIADSTTFPSSGSHMVSLVISCPIKSIAVDYNQGHLWVLCGSSMLYWYDMNVGDKAVLSTGPLSLFVVYDSAYGGIMVYAGNASSVLGVRRNATGNGFVKSSYDPFPATHNGYDLFSGLQSITISNTSDYALIDSTNCAMIWSQLSGQVSTPTAQILATYFDPVSRGFFFVNISGYVSMWTNTTLAWSVAAGGFLEDDSVSNSSCGSIKSIVLTMIMNTTAGCSASVGNCSYSGYGSVLCDGQSVVYFDAQLSPAVPPSTMGQITFSNFVVQANASNPYVQMAMVPPNSTWMYQPKAGSGEYLLVGQGNQVVIGDPYRSLTSLRSPLAACDEGETVIAIAVDLLTSNQWVWVMCQSSSFRTLKVYDSGNRVWGTIERKNGTGPSSISVNSALSPQVVVCYGLNTNSTAIVYQYQPGLSLTNFTNLATRTNHTPCSAVALSNRMFFSKDGHTVYIPV
eukprot:TRINITY_DN2513_c0_g1_i10.p1 TRINITY_DN2513_c0_g1~~TRINITY_DN2513_c0_g1_i10.p1  ORF type:complete len:848 (+),score=116.59 TRINITY_DN2513_c0_g1_i10:334-2544(+)